MIKYVMKSFLKNILSKRKVINNIILNILGLQVFRIFISRIFEMINRGKILKILNMMSLSLKRKAF